MDLRPKAIAESFSILRKEKLVEAAVIGGGIGGVTAAAPAGGRGVFPKFAAEVLLLEELVGSLTPG